MTLSPEETQPRLEKTRPITPYRGRGIWLMLMFISSVSLTVTLWWAFLPRSVPIAPRNPVSVTLWQDGQSAVYRTTADTVQAFLAENGIVLDSNDALSPPADAPIVPNMMLTIARARDIVLVVDGVQTLLRTPFQLPYDILQQAKLTLSPLDRVWLDGNEVSVGEVILWGNAVREIVIKRAIRITIMDEDTAISHRTTADTVGEALLEANVMLYLTDVLTPAQSESLSDGMVITIDRAQPITLRVDGQTLSTRAQGGTVADALNENGVTLIGLDYVVPNESTPLENVTLIQVIRVTEETFSTDTPIPFETVYEADSTLALDARAVRQNGQSGILRRSERVRYENGIEISREDLGESVVQAPQNAVIAYGTNVVLYPLETPEGTLYYWRKLRVYATSYRPKELGGDNITAIGEVLRRGVIGADPKIIPYRTPIYVFGYGQGIVADTGGPRSSPYWIDLGYTDEDYVGWAKYVDIYLLEPIPSTINYLLPEWRPLRNTTGY